MNGTAAVRRVARFGPFEFDVANRELRKGGVKLRLQDQPLLILSVLLDRPGELVTRDELRERLWPADTFVDFDHSLNTAVRKLRAALNDSADAPRFIETVARHGYRFIALVEPQDALEVRTPRIRSVAAWAGPIAVAVAVAASVYFRPSAAELPRDVRSIAVLPFETDDDDREYLAEGLADAVTDELSLSQDLRVAARTSAFRYKDKPFDPRKLADELKVDAVVSGNIVGAGNEQRLHVELVELANGAQLWAKEYPVRTETLNALERYVAADLALRLGATTADQGRPAKTSPAYDLYLRGRYHWNRRRRDDLVRAIGYFERAVQIDPKFALAWAGLGNAYGAFAGNRFMPGSESELQAKSSAAVEKALSLDPTIAEAYASRAAGKTSYHWDFEGAERDFRRAIELKPNYASARQWYSELLWRTGRFAESRREIDIAYSLEPFSIAITSFVCWNRFYERRFDEAIAFCRRTEAIDPSLVNRACHNWSHLVKGEYEDAIAAIRTFSPINADELAQAFRSGGRQAFWEKRIEQYEASRSSPYLIAAAYAAIGDRERAFANLDRCVREREPGTANLYVDPRFDNLRSDPRFDELARRIGLPQVRGVSSGPGANASGLNK